MAVYTAYKISKEQALSAKTFKYCIYQPIFQPIDIKNYAVSNPKKFIKGGAKIKVR